MFSDSPLFTVLPEDVTGNNGDKINLRCEVDSNPPAVVSWTKDGNKYKKVGEGSVLSFTLSNDTSGSYSCEAAVAGFSSISSVVTVQRHSPPVILAERWKWSSLGETVMVACEAESFPSPTEISWKFSGKFIRPDSADFSILETQDGRIAKSTIIIRNIRSEQFGEYECNFQNDFGKDSSKIHIAETDSLPILIVISAGISGVLLTIVIIVVVLTCKNVSKASETEVAWNEKHSKTCDNRCLDSSSVSYRTNTKTTKGSSIGPESYGILPASQPDIVNSHPPTPSHIEGHDYANPYSDYRQFKSERHLVNHLQYDNYFNPFTQMTVPVCTSSVKSSTSYNTPSHLYGNVDHGAASISRNNEHNGMCGNDEDDLDESSPRTHV